MQKEETTGTQRGSNLYTHIWEGKTKCFLDIQPTATVKVWSCMRAKIGLKIILNNGGLQYKHYSTIHMPIWIYELSTYCIL